MRRIGKRGFWMTEEISKFFMGIVAVVLLIFLLVKLGGLVVDQNRFEQARYVMGEIEKAIKLVEEDGKEKIIFVESPKDWYLVDYYGIYPNRPKVCGDAASCLCLCKSDKQSDDVEIMKDYFFEGSGLAGCSSGVCFSRSNNVRAYSDRFSSVDRTSDPYIDFYSSNNRLYLIRFDDVPFNLNINKQGGDIFVYRT